MTVAAFNHQGVVYYLQRTSKRDTYEIRVNPGRQSRLIKRVESKSEWREFIAGLQDV